MKRYVIRYRDEAPESPIFTVRVIAHDAEDAEERFFSGPDAEGWVVVSIAAERSEFMGETVRQERGRHARDEKRRRHAHSAATISTLTDSTQGRR